MDLCKGGKGKMNKIHSVVLAGLILMVLTTTTSAAVNYKTDTYTYNTGQPVKFTLYNYNFYPMELDVRWPSVYTSSGECIYGCGFHIMNYEGTVIPAFGKYSWTWDQKDDNGSQVPVGYYVGELNEYSTNAFQIKGGTQSTTNTITVRGHIEEGVEMGCTMLHSDGGSTYELAYSGSLPPVGSYVMVRGTIMEGMASTCMQGPILKVQYIFVIG